MREFLIKKQHIVVRGLLEESGRVIVVRSPKGPTLEYYEFPGGYVEFGKDPSEALVDLFFAQTRIPVNVDAPFHTTSWMSPNEDVQTVEIVYRVRPRERFDMAKGGCDTILWIELDDAGYFLSSRITDTIRASQ